MVGPAGSCLGMDDSLLLVQMQGGASGFEQKELKSVRRERCMYLGRRRIPSLWQYSYVTESRRGRQLKALSCDVEYSISITDVRQKIRQRKKEKNVFAQGMLILRKWKPNHKQNHVSQTWTSLHQNSWLNRRQRTQIVSSKQTAQPTERAVTHPSEEPSVVEM